MSVLWHAAACLGRGALGYYTHSRRKNDLIIADLNEIAGRTYPARRRTQNLVGGASPIQAKNFSLGNVTLEPRGGQVPWHNQEQEERSEERRVGKECRAAWCRSH